MRRLPFNPEPLLALFMSKENAGSLAGDLEERFQRVCQRKGWREATVWFLVEFTIFLASRDYCGGAVRTTFSPNSGGPSNSGWTESLNS